MVFHISVSDFVNGMFELLGLPFIVISIAKLLRDKKVCGVSWHTICFFTIWGYWNLFYYPHLSQWLSFCGGLTIVIANSIWLCLLIYYSKKGKQ